MSLVLNFLFSKKKRDQNGRRYNGQKNEEVYLSDGKRGDESRNDLLGDISDEGRPSNRQSDTFSGNISRGNSGLRSSNENSPLKSKESINDSFSYKQNQLDTLVLELTENKLYKSMKS